MEKDYVEQNVKKSGFENPEFRASVIGRLVDDLNNHYKENNINIVLDKDEIIKKAKDEEAYKNHLEAKKILDDYGKRQQIQSSIDKINGVKSDSGMGRVIHYNLTIPDGTNDEEINDNNKEIVRYYRNQKNASKIIFQKTKDLYNLELKDFFPTSIEEVIENAKNKRPALDDAFVIKSIYENNGFTQNQTLKDNGFSYYLTTFESGDATLTALKMEASDIGYLLPSCVNAEDIYGVMSGFNKYYEENEKENHQIIQEALNLTSGSLGLEREDRFEFNKYVREFIEKKATDKDFFKKYSIGGDSFLKKMEENYENNVKVEDIEINESFKDTDKGLNKYPDRKMSLVLKDGKDLYNKCVDKINKKDLSVIDDLGKIPVDNNNNTALYNSYLFKRIYEKAKNNNINVSALEEKYNDAANHLKIKAKHIDSFDLILKNDNYEKLVYDIEPDGEIKYNGYYQVDTELFNNPNHVFVQKVAKLEDEVQELRRKQESTKDPFEEAKLVYEISEKNLAYKYLLKKGLDELGLKDNRSDSLESKFKSIFNADKALPKDYFEKNYDEAINSKNSIEHEDKFKEFKEKYHNEQEKLNLIEKSLILRNGDFAESADIEKPFDKSSSKYMFKNPLNEEIKKNDDYKNTFVKSVSSLEFAPKNNPVGSKKAREAKFKLSDNTKKNILLVANKMKELGVFDKNDLNKDLLEIGEEGGKEYAFRAYFAQKRKVENYTKELDFEKAAIEAQKTEDLRKKYDELLDLVEKTFPQDGKHMPGNLSPCRNKEIEEKYVKRVQSVSQLNGIYNALAFCERNKIDFEQFINEPQKQMDEFTKSRVDILNEKYNPAKKESLLNMLMAEPMDKDWLPGRAIEAIGILETDKTIINENAISQIYFDQVNSVDIRQGGDFFVKKGVKGNEPDYEGLRNYMAGGAFFPASDFLTDSFDFAAGKMRKGFDYDGCFEADIRFTNEVYNGVIDKICDTLEEANKNEDQLYSKCNLASVVACSVTYLSDYLVKKNLDPSKDKDALMVKKFIDDPIRVLYQKMRDRNPEKFPEVTNGNYVFGERVSLNGYDNELSATNNLRKAYNDKYVTPLTTKYQEARNQSFNACYKNAIKDNVKANSVEFLTAAKVLQDKYDSRSILKTIFTPSTWFDGWKVKWMRDKAVNGGVDPAKYDKLMNTNYGRVDSLINDVRNLKNDADSYAIEHNLIEDEPQLDVNSIHEEQNLDINPVQNVKADVVENVIVDDEYFEDEEKKQPNPIPIQEEQYREKVDVVNNDSSKKDDEIEFDYNRMNV